MDPMKVDSLILSETMRRISLRPYRLHQLLNTKSSSLMKQIIQPQTFNSSYGRLLRSLVATVDSFSPATIKTKSFNQFIPDAPSLISQSEENKKPNWQNPSSSVYRISWMKKASNMIKKSLRL